MIAAVELTDLYRSHGTVGIVNGFPHYSYDVTLTGSGTGTPHDSWSDNLFPFKLGQYNKRLLSHPVCIATLDIESFYDNDYSIDINGILDIYESGVCHCIAIYIELDNTQVSTLHDNNNTTNTSAYNNTAYNNSNNNILHGIQSDIGDFPLHLTTSLKFLPEPVNVSRGGTGLSYRMKFEYGDSDLLFEFNTVYL